MSRRPMKPDDARRAFARSVRARGSRCRGGRGVLRQFRPRRGARRQCARAQDLRPRPALGLGGRGARRRRCITSRSAATPRNGAAQGAHRGERRRSDRSAGRIREQRLLVPQPRRRADRGQGRAQSVARPQIGQHWISVAGRASPARPCATRRRRFARAGCRMC